ncbi:unnamed protein product [Ectocarpus sp. CCAP 1310/34]|nr:unnamed protein product [Ectocarpus sp. CCAP 1310/34]
MMEVAVVLRQRAFFLSKVRGAVQRMALVERRLSEQDNDLTEYRVTRSKAEGAVAALRGRQELATTMKTALTAEMQRSQAKLDQDKRWMEAILKKERKQHEDVMVAWKEQMDTLSQQVKEAETKWRRAEAADYGMRRNSIPVRWKHDTVAVHDSIQCYVASARVNALISEAKQTASSRWPSEPISNTSSQRMIETPHAPLFTFARCTENQIRGVELTTASLERHLTGGEGSETARIRRELQDSEGSLQRRIEEVRASDVRRMEEISGEVLRERENRLKDRAEVNRDSLWRHQTTWFTGSGKINERDTKPATMAHFRSVYPRAELSRMARDMRSVMVEKEVSNVRASLERTEQYWHGRIHDRLDRLEGSMASTLSDHSHTQSLVTSIGSQLKQLQLEIQNARDTRRRAGQWASDRRGEAPSRAIGNHHTPILAQVVQSAARPSQTTASTLAADSPKTALEESGEVLPEEQDGARGSTNTIAREEGVESTTGAMIPAVQACDDQPTPLECSSAVGLCSMPGGVTPADATAGQGSIDQDDYLGDVDNKSCPLRDGDSAPFKSGQRSVGSVVDNGKDSETQYPFKTGEGTGTPEQRGTLPEPPPVDRLHVHRKAIHTSSADTLRALAAVSFSAEEDAALAASAEEVGDGHPSQLIRGPSPRSSPSSVPSCGSSAPSSSPPPPSPMSPPHTPSVNSTGAPQADDPGGAEKYFAATSPAEALDPNVAPPKLLGDGLGASDSSKIADTEAGGSDVSQSRMAASTKPGSSSDSSFSVDDDEAVVGQQRGLGLRETCDNDHSTPTTTSRPGGGKTCAPTSSLSTSTTSERGTCDDVSATPGVSTYGGRVHHKNPQKGPPPRAPPPEMPLDMRRKSMAAVSTGPAPVSFRDRSASKVTGLVRTIFAETRRAAFSARIPTKLIVLFAEVTTEPLALRCMPVVSWQDSGVVTAQCEFCLRRYLKSAMSTHLQVCELRLVRCPFQCGVKVLVRNLEKHMGSCSMKESAESEGVVNASATPTRVRNLDATASTRAGPPNETTRKKGDEHASHGETDEGNARQGGVLAIGPGPEPGPGPGPGPGSGPGDADRTVTCMRCHESLPFHLVPSHGPKCKGKKGEGELGARATAGSPSGTSERWQGPPSGFHYPPPFGAAVDFRPPSLRSPVSSQSRSGVGGNPLRGGLSTPPILSSAVGTHGSTLSSLSSSGPGDTGAVPKVSSGRSVVTPCSPAVSPKAWHASSRIGTVLTPGVRVPPSPPRLKDVRAWGTRQVTSWLREIMRPPRADIISKFHDSGVDGTALLSVTDRYLLHPTEGLGITDEVVRRQILEAMDSLKVGL